MTAAPPEVSACLDEERVVELLHGTLVPTARAVVASHLGSCSGCRQLVAKMTLALSGPAQAGEDLAPLHAGSTLGRYVVIGPVGGGSMGLVYAAFDRELGRKVALKLLRPAALDSSSADLLSARLRREAQALALLSHPNVVAVHEVDTFEGRIFLAMEFVEGSTLGAWLRETTRGWREVIAVFRQAGEGLAAAHAAGLVHRDFKPDNVLVGADGRVRVTDFGLARADHERPETPAPAGGAPALADSLTATGALVGTPAYMAPEQLVPAGRADALSDQFAFCVALFETLCGQRPFEAADIASLGAAIREGRVRAPPPKRRVPRWLLRIILRGLAAEPQARWPSMRALLDAIVSGPLVTPARVLIPALALAALGFFVWSSRSVCTGADAAWGALWNAEEQRSIHEAFRKTGRPTAEPAFAYVALALDAFHVDWLAAHRDACLANRVRHEQSEALLDRRMVCLAEGRRRAQAVVHAFAAADAALVERAPSVLEALPPLEACSNATALLAPVPQPDDPAKRARIAALEGTLAETVVLANVGGKTTLALAALAPALVEARQIGYLPLVARMLVQRSRLEISSDKRAAQETLHEAAAVALEGHDDESLADAWSFGIYASASPEEGHRFARYSAAAIARLGNDDEREGTRLGYLAGVLLWSENQYEEARPLVLRSRELLVRARGPDFWRVAFDDDTLGAIALNAGRGEEALAAFTNAEAIRTKAFGPESSYVSVSLTNVGTTLYWLGRMAESEAALRRSIEIARRSAPEGNNYHGHKQLAQTLRSRGDYAEALSEDVLSEQLLSRFVAPDARSHCDTWIGQGADLLGLGRAREAVALLERGLQLCRQDVDSYDPARTELLLARALWDSGGDKQRARQLAAASFEGFKVSAGRYGSWFNRLRDEAAAWIAAHP